MFNSNLKKEALKIHGETLEKYNNSYERMKKLCEELYETRGRCIELLVLIQRVINSICNTPKEFDTEFGKIGNEITKFNETEEYAKKAYDTSLKAGVNIVGGAAAGLGIASMAPTALMSIATTFGTASTGTAISTLSGAAAQKAALGWIGRTFAGFAVKGSAGMAAGQAFLALAGPVGWGITAASTGISLITLNNKNKELADDAIKDAMEIAKARNVLDGINEKIRALKSKTDVLFEDLDRQRTKIMEFMNLDYVTMKEEDKLFLGTLVNNTLSLSLLLNENVE